MNRKIIYILTLLSVWTFVSGCVQFQPISLYDSVEKRTKEAESAAIIFKDARGTLWTSLGECGKAEITSEVECFEGTKCLKLEWDKGRAGCDWAGIGNSWNNWAPADISQDLEKKAVSFYIRTIEGEVGGAGIVVALDDMSETGAYLFADSKKYLKALKISEEWTQMILPFWDFPYKRDQVDYFGIKQMKFQFEGAGKFYVDNIEVIDYSREQYAKDRAYVESLRPKGEPRQDVYVEGVGDAAWGMGETFCQTLVEQSDSTRPHFLSWKWDATNDCGWAKWGINWNEWQKINFRGVHQNMVLLMDVQFEKDATFTVKFKDFKYHEHAIEIDSKKYAAKPGEWKTIILDVETWKLNEKDFSIGEIRSLEFNGTGKGKVWLDNIRFEPKNEKR